MTAETVILTVKLTLLSSFYVLVNVFFCIFICVYFVYDLYNKWPEKWYGILHRERYHLKKWYGFGRVCRIGCGNSALFTF